MIMAFLLKYVITTQKFNMIQMNQAVRKPVFVIGVNRYEPIYRLISTFVLSIFSRIFILVNSISLIYEVTWLLTKKTGYIFSMHLTFQGSPFKRCIWGP